jgi:hypothetical protein
METYHICSSRVVGGLWHALRFPSFSRSFLSRSMFFFSFANWWLRYQPWFFQQSSIHWSQFLYYAQPLFFSNRIRTVKSQRSAKFHLWVILSDYFPRSVFSDGSPRNILIILDLKRIQSVLSSLLDLDNVSTPSLCSSWTRRDPAPALHQLTP